MFKLGLIPNQTPPNNEVLNGGVQNWFVRKIGFSSVLLRSFCQTRRRREYSSRTQGKLEVPESEARPRCSSDVYGFTVFLQLFQIWLSLDIKSTVVWAPGWRDVSLKGLHFAMEFGWFHRDVIMTWDELSFSLCPAAVQLLFVLIDIVTTFDILNGLIAFRILELKSIGF